MGLLRVSKSRRVVQPAGTMTVPQVTACSSMRSTGQLSMSRPATTKIAAWHSSLSVICRIHSRASRSRWLVDTTDRVAVCFPVALYSAPAISRHRDGGLNHTCGADLPARISGLSTLSHCSTAHGASAQCRHANPAAIPGSTAPLHYLALGC